VAAFSSPLGSILNLGVRMTFVRVPEPSRALLLTAHQSDPLVAATAKSFPHVRIPIHSPGLLGFLERIPCCCTDAVGETLVIPESRVLQHKPAARFADTAPAFALVAMAAHPSGRVQITIESQLLLMGNKILIGRIHILGWGRHLFLVERSI
jgi:hypothetical protein